jgi:hypothetical protein
MLLTIQAGRRAKWCYAPRWGFGALQVFVQKGKELASLKLMQFVLTSSPSVEFAVVKLGGHDQAFASSPPGPSKMDAAEMCLTK